MKLKTILPIILLCLLLVGCTTQEPVDKNEPIKNNSPSTIETVPENKTTTSPTDADLIIVAGRIEPDELTLKINSKVTLTVHNQEKKTMRLSIPMYQSEVNADIPANSYEVIVLEPKYTGYTSMELNGNKLGTIKVE